MHKVASRGDTYKTEKFIFHPKFNNKTSYDDFDISIVTVDRSMKFTSVAKPICLPSIDDDYSGKSVTVAGW